MDLEYGVWNMENRTRLEHRQQNMIGTWTTEQNWNKDNRTGLKHGTDQVCNKDTRTGLEPGEYGKHDSFKIRTRFEHRKQKKIGTWTTEQDWNRTTEFFWKKDRIRVGLRIPEQVWNQRNMENITALEQGQDWSMDNRTKKEHGQQNKIGTQTTEENWNKENWNKDKDQVWIKDTRTGLEPGEHDIFGTRTT